MVRFCDQKLTHLFARPVDSFLSRPHLATADRLAKGMDLGVDDLQVL